MRASPRPDHRRPWRRAAAAGVVAVLAGLGGTVPSTAASPAIGRSVEPLAEPADRSAAPARGGRFDRVPGAGEQRYIVRTDGTAALDRVAARLGGLGVTQIDRFEHALTALVVDATPGRADALAHLPGVVSVAATVPVRVAGDVAAQGTQTFPLGSGLWGLDRIDQTSRSLNGRFDYASAGVGVTAYVLDTGLHASHTEFRGRVSLARSYYVPFEGDTSGIDDCFGHGTGVAGVLGGTTTGVAKGVTIVPVKVLDCFGHGDDSTVIAGIDHVVADHKAGSPAVANLSVAGKYSTTLNAAVQGLIADGVTVVIASGNSGVDACTVSPGSLTTAITVGATTSSDIEASFSNTGKCVDILAPGQGIRAPYPFVTRTRVTPSDVTYTSESGTSFATSFVAGAAVLALQRNPSLTPAQVAANLVSSATTGALTVARGSPNRLLYLQQVAAPVTGIDGLNAYPAAVRMVDTRPTTTGTNYKGALELGDEATPLASGTVRRYPLVGVRDIPEDATVVLNVIAVAPQGGGNLVVWPCATEGSARPAVNWLNYSPGATVANSGVVGIGPEGGICVAASGTTDLIIDVVGWIPPGDTVSPMRPPVRLLDTRPTTNGSTARGALEVTVDEATPFTAGAVRRYVVAGVGGLPASGARSVALNVTSTLAVTSGALRVYPCDDVSTTAPAARTMMFTQGVTVAAGAVVPLSDGGAFCVASTGTTDVVLDVTAWFASGAGYATFAAPYLPVRLLDTRSGEMGSLEGVDRTVPLAAQTTGGTEFVIAGSGGLPSASVMRAAALTITVYSPTGSGYLRVWRCASGSSTAPTSSVLNFRTGVSTSNLVVASVDNTAGTAGGVCVQTSRTVHLSIDVSGWFLRSPP